MIKKAKLFYIIILAISITFVTIGLLSIILNKYHNKILPNSIIINTDLGGLTKKEALQALSKNLNVPQKIILFYNSDNFRQEFEISLDAIGLKYDLEGSINKVYTKGRSGNILNNLKEIVRSQKNPAYYDLEISFDEEALNNELSVIAGQISVEPIKPSVVLGKSGIIVNKGKIGEEINTNNLKEKILKNLKIANFSPVQISRTIIDPTISDSEAQILAARAQKLVKKSLNLTYDSESIELSAHELLSLLGSKEGYDEENINKLILDITKKVNREPTNPTFVFLDDKVKEFEPARDGLSVKQDELKTKIIESLSTLENQDIKTIELEIPTINTAPDFRTEDVNNLGIKELIGKGVSYFRGSPSSRIFNINLAASRLNGVLIKPDEVFSFNAALGDVSKLTGYKEAYIIKNNQTILGDGGGVCQVSTTVFRAALSAGLPIIERRPHTYRVSYYEQGFSPGLDATVYAPAADLKIKNNTPGHILIQSRIDNKTSTLTFEFYGTKDGRVAETTKPVITDSTPPPDDLYIDDPTLPAGQIKQIEHKAWGAKVKFNYIVSKDNQVIYRKTFYSNYKPWGAVYLKGTGPSI